MTKVITRSTQRTVLIYLLWKTEITLDIFQIVNQLSLMLNPSTHLKHLMDVSSVADLAIKVKMLGVFNYTSFLLRFNSAIVLLLITSTR